MHFLNSIQLTHPFSGSSIASASASERSSKKAVVTVDSPYPGFFGPDFPGRIFSLGTLTLSKINSPVEEALNDHLL